MESVGAAGLVSVAFLTTLATSVCANPQIVEQFAIESPSQTDNSVLLVWETDREVRTLRGVSWTPSLPTGATHQARRVAGEGLGGSAAVCITGTESAGEARGCYLQNLGQNHPAGSYTYRMSYRTSEQQQGNARVLIDCYVGEQRKYVGLVSRSLPAVSDWTEVSGSFELPDDVVLMRCLLYQMGAGTAWYDDVRIMAGTSGSNLLNDGTFDSDGGWRVAYRRKGTTAWQDVDAVVLERFHNVIFLEPATLYEFRVRRLTADGMVAAESQVLAVSTVAAGHRVWHGLRCESDQRTPTPPAVYPCIESVGGKLYYSESRGGSLWLSELDDHFQSRWTKEWVKPYLVDGRPCYQGQTQTAVLGDRIYISWKRAHHGDAPHARQCVAWYDVPTGEIGQPLVVEPDTPSHSTWNGGIAAVNGKLWISYCLWKPAGDGYRTQVTLRQLDAETGKLGPVVVLAAQPTETPYTPFLSTFGGELVVCFTDSQSHTDMQPLWLVRFDGKRFHDLMTISPRGFNQYAKGIEFGNRLLLVWKYGEAYPSRLFGRYMFHDIGLALVDMATGRIEITSLVDDIKYNSSPDITWHNGRLIYVYNKFEHLYGSANDPGQQYGCFIGSILPEGDDSRSP